MSASNPFYVLDYDSDSDEPTVASIESGPALGPSSQYYSASHSYRRDTKPRSSGSVLSPDVELETYRLRPGLVIEPGDTVELIDHSEQDAAGNHSGDFLQVKQIIKDLSTDEVRLRGLPLRRTKYVGQVFDWRLNELAMVLQVSADDDRNPLVAGLKDVVVDEVFGKRECVFTHKCYPLQSWQIQPGWNRYSTSKAQAIRNVFYNGPLCCRVVYIRFMNRNGKDASGVVRHLYGVEVGNTDAAPSPTRPGLSQEHSLIIEDDEDEDAVIVSEVLQSERKRRARADSVEVIESPPKRRSPLPIKGVRYTFGDVFCGVGGASQGAVQAGLHVCWGLDNDEDAITAYHLNHGGALPFCENAHKFSPRGFCAKDLHVDILHLSPPCCYWSPAHTHEGPNDQANYEAIYTVGPILRAIKPRVATLEQTFGLMTHEQHQKNFKMLLNDIGQAGYDLRYKIQDMSKLGLVQRRKRLLIIAARRGTPLPPFPEETHGEPGSGLKPFTFIKDALRVMERLGPRASDDPYHQPKPMASAKTPYDPRSFLKGCITTGGGDNYHFSGKRRYTPREMALFQSFPYEYQFSGRPSQAMKQVGNAFPPGIAEAMYRTIRMTLEAYDDGLIGAEDDLTDLEGIFAQLRLASTRPSVPPTPHTFFDGSSDARASVGITTAKNEKTHDADSDDDEVVFLGSTRRN
ncbi:S-adenosyl-L-methionine-dependent methyltransferase [Didymella exigua CBS 183.55]|uniref:DNA (cytosine-5-)-methyltransferase n=1 Tax=Didymella exigua CBS 183.55 TaxID=1150837 RepID=A0A6A5RLV7_9PLEO|nr:S-adenosyl-L-methionine-dependent methyltransferase [Didymella exigua CBS 183.55]KAF1929411.1 S-adenosyl-L-methionine-dependent methyltransferase [Didymella exigua CBS 183.55]